MEELSKTARLIIPAYRVKYGVGDRAKDVYLHQRPRLPELRLRLNSGA